MLPRDITYFGGEKQDAEPVSDLDTEMPASDWNKLVSDVCKLTRAGGASVSLRFQTRGTNGALTLSNVATEWGTGLSFGPLTALRTSAGVYVLTWPATMTNPDIGGDETVSLSRGTWNIKDTLSTGSGVGAAQGTCAVDCSGAVVTVRVFNVAGTLSDLSSTALIEVQAF